MDRVTLPASLRRAVRPLLALDTAALDDRISTLRRELLQLEGLRAFMHGGRPPHEEPPRSAPNALGDLVARYLGQVRGVHIIAADLGVDVPHVERVLADNPSRFHRQEARGKLGWTLVPKEAQA